MIQNKKPRISRITQIKNLLRICVIRGIWGFLFFAFSLHAATSFGQTIKGEVIAGFGGYYRIGKCMPVKINLENSGADLSGEISIQISRTVFTQAVSLPSPSRKTYIFYVTPPKYFQELEVKLVSEGKLLNVFTSSVHRVSDDEQLVLKSSTLKPLSPETSFSEGQKEKVAFLDPQDFSESWNDYEAVNAIILDASDVIRLNEAQRNALSRWTMLGGVATLFNRDKEPSTRNSLGLGSFGGIEKQAKPEDASYQPSLLDLDEEIFKALRVREPMQHAGIVWPLGAFLILFGIVVALCLWMAKKPGLEKIWIYAALPACAILFSALSPLTSRVVNGGNTLARQYSVLHVFANGMDAFATYDLSLIFPRKGESKLSPAIQSPYLVQGESDNSTDLIHYEFEGNQTPAAVFNTNMGSTKLISLSGFSSRGPYIVLHDMDSLTLTNKSQNVLHDCTLISNGVSATIGDIPPGKEIRLKSDLDASGFKPPARRSQNMLSKTIDVYETETLAGSTGDCVICAMDGAIPSLTSDNWGLSYIGSTAVIYHLGKHRHEESDLVKQ